MALTVKSFAALDSEQVRRPIERADTAGQRKKFGTMARLITVALIIALGNGSTSFAEAKTPSRHKYGHSFSDRIASYVAEAEKRFSIPASWIYAVMHVESHGVRHAISPKGAMGLMQIMPKTWASLRDRYHLGPDPFELRDNILAGTAYLRELHDLYGSPGDLAAYNAGPERYEEYRDHRRSLPAETRAYVAKLAPVISARPPPDRRPGDPISQLFAAAAGLFAGHTEPQSFVVRTTAHVQPRSTIRRRQVTDLTAITPRSTGLFVHLSSREKTP